MKKCSQGCNNGVLNYGPGLSFECICAKRARARALKAAMAGHMPVEGVQIKALHPTGPGIVAALELTAPAVPEDLSGLSLYDLAQRIRRDWKNVYFGAVPYLQAMAGLQGINDNYGMNTRASIVAYFLSNASAWRGPVAKAVKAELNRRLKASYGKAA